MQGKFTKVFMPHQRHLRHSSSSITFHISDNHGEQRYLFLAVLSCLSVDIWFGNKNKSNFTHKLKHNSFTKSSYKIIQSNKKAMPMYIIHEWATITSAKCAWVYHQFSLIANDHFVLRLSITVAMVQHYSHHLWLTMILQLRPVSVCTGCITRGHPDKEGQYKQIQRWASNSWFSFQSQELNMFQCRLSRSYTFTGLRTWNQE